MNRHIHHHKNKLQPLSSNTKNLLKKIKISMTKKKNREIIDHYKIPLLTSKSFKHKKSKYKKKDTHRLKNKYSKKKEENKHIKHNKDTYISKLIDLYYDNDNVSKQYLNTAHKNLHILPHQRRVIVFGDVHGDLEATLECFIIAKCINKITLPKDKSVKNMNSFFKKLKWIGGDTYVVQLGDQIDRVRPQRWDSNDITKDNAFKDEGTTLEILYLFYYLNELASKNEGRVFSIIGNHEIMNVEADFRYVSLKEFKCFKNHLIKTYKRNSKYPYDSNTLKNNSHKFKYSKTKKRNKFDDINDTYSNNIYKNINIDYDDNFTEVPEGFRERLYAFSPTGICANLIGSNNYVLLQIGNWLFCHGSPVLETIQTYTMDLINNIVSMYLLGIDNKNKYIEQHYYNITKSHNNSVLWNRTFGDTNINNEKEKELLNKLDTILNEYNNKNNVYHKATHIAIGHTTQYSSNKGINSICNNRVWRCDVGMSRAFGSRESGSHRNPQVLEILNINGIEQINILK